MTPPTTAQVEGTYRSVLKSMSGGSAMAGMKSMSGKEMVKLGVDGLIIYGFFCFVWLPLGLPIHMLMGYRARW